MKCIDEPYQIWGDYNSEITTNLLVVFEHCNRTAPGNNCKSKEEAEEALKGKYIFALENERRFT